MVGGAKQTELDYMEGGTYMHSAQSRALFLGGLGMPPGNQNLGTSSGTFCKIHTVDYLPLLCNCTNNIEYKN